MKVGRFELNFTCKPNNSMQTGRIQVFSCPSDEKTNIVKFISIRTDKCQSNTQMMAKVYEAILQRGGAKLMVGTEAKRKELKAEEKKRIPDWEQMDDFLSER